MKKINVLLAGVMLTAAIRVSTFCATQREMQPSASMEYTVILQV